MAKEIKYGLGFKPSPEDKRDLTFYTLPTLAEEYTLKDPPKIFDQGSSQICTAVSVSEAMDWRLGIRSGWKALPVGKMDIYNMRTTSGEGMYIRDALKQVKKHGVMSGEDRIHIKYYARANGIDSVKTAILVNGPVVIGTYAYDNYVFWRPKGENIGGHATVLIGWDKKGFILQNSWGRTWGEKGRMLMTYDEFEDYVIEAWTVFV